MIFHIDV